MSGDLTTLANAREWLQQNLITANDSLITRLISAASTFMQQTLMSRDIAVATYVEARNGMGGKRMVMMTFPIRSVASVMVNGVQIPERPGALGNGFVFDQTSIMLTGYEFCKGAQNVEVVYEAGYTSTPPDLEQACLDLVSGWFKYRDRIGKTSESIEGQSISFSVQDVSPLDRQVCNGYRRVSPVY